LINSHDFAVQKRIGWEPFASGCNMRELSGKEIASA
jgi:hypothetical protein